jgi:hypothetical protein
MDPPRSGIGLFGAAYLLLAANPWNRVEIATDLPTSGLAEAVANSLHFIDVKKYKPGQFAPPLGNAPVFVRQIENASRVAHVIFSWFFSALGWSIAEWIVTTRQGVSFRSGS